MLIVIKQSQNRDRGKGTQMQSPLPRAAWLVLWMQASIPASHLQSKPFCRVTAELYFKETQTEPWDFFLFKRRKWTCLQRTWKFSASRLEENLRKELCCNSGNNRVRKTVFLQGKFRQFEFIQFKWIKKSEHSGVLKRENKSSSFRRRGIVYTADSPCRYQYKVLIEAVSSGNIWSLLPFFICQL